MMMMMMITGIILGALISTPGCTLIRFSPITQPKGDNYYGAEFISKEVRYTRDKDIGYMYALPNLRLMPGRLKNIYAEAEVFPPGSKSAFLEFYIVRVVDDPGRLMITWQMSVNYKAMNSGSKLVTIELDPTDQFTILADDIIAVISNCLAFHDTIISREIITFQSNVTCQGANLKLNKRYQFIRSAATRQYHIGVQIDPQVPQTDHYYNKMLATLACSVTAHLILLFIWLGWYKFKPRKSIHECDSYEILNMEQTTTSKTSSTCHIYEAIRNEPRRKNEYNEPTRLEEDHYLRVIGSRKSSPISDHLHPPSNAIYANIDTPSSDEPIYDRMYEKFNRRQDDHVEPPTLGTSLYLPMDGITRSCISLVGSQQHRPLPSPPESEYIDIALLVEENKTDSTDQLDNCPTVRLRESDYPNPSSSSKKSCENISRYFNENNSVTPKRRVSF